MSIICMIRICANLDLRGSGRRSTSRHPGGVGCGPRSCTSATGSSARAAGREGSFVLTAGPMRLRTGQSRTVSLLTTPARTRRAYGRITWKPSPQPKTRGGISPTKRTVSMGTNTRLKTLDPASTAGGGARNATGSNSERETDRTASYRSRIVRTARTDTNGPRRTPINDRARRADVASASVTRNVATATASGRGDA